MDIPVPEAEQYQEAVAILERMAGLPELAVPQLASVVERTMQSAVGGGRGKIWKPDRRYRSLVEQLPAVTFMCGLDESIQELYISPQIEGLLGFTQEEWLENPLLWYRQLHPDDRQHWVEQFALTCATGAHFRSEYRLINRAGQIVWIQGECQIIRDDEGKPLFMQGIAIDITHLKRAAEAVEGKSRAEAANAAKSEFLARMSHEIRTPLNGVVGMIDLLCATGMTEIQQRYAQLAKDAASALLVVINDILDFSKIEAGKVEIEAIEFDLHKLIEDTTELLAPLAVKKDLVLGSLVRPEVPRTVLGDPNRIRQIITNLVSNALKFTQKGGVSVRISLDSVEDHSAVVRVKVEDTGIGIPADRLDRLFKSFSQVDGSTTRKFGGTGLGLVISKRLTELMGGQIGVSSVEGQGTTFWFTVTLGVVAPKEAVSFRHVRVLAVEPDPAYRKLLEEQLEGRFSTGCRVVDEADAVDALRQAAKEGQPFDLAMVYYRGKQSLLQAAIRYDPALKQLPLIAILQANDKSDHRSLRKAGFSALIHCPVNQSKLVDAVASITQKRDTADKPAEPASAQQVLAFHLLVAEDNEMNQFVIRETLKRAGCTCDIVSDGAQAVEAARRGGHHAILMDCQMPEMDGLEASRRIRQWEASGAAQRRIPIIALTAEALQGDKEKCLAAGMDAYVTKPISADELFAALRLFVRPEDVQTVGQPNANSAAGASQKPLPPPIAVEELFTRCMRDGEFARQTLQRFHRRALDDVQRLRQLLADRDAQAVARL
ncbi:MAG TPA: ATP-binding protein, partial [Tepidisphaeraceae bacterium]|nr:ATP-binding protein [Tepidisphaeraceae bacterium]